MKQNLFRDQAGLLQALLTAIILLSTAGCSATPETAVIPIHTSTQEATVAAIPIGSPTLQYKTPEPAILGITYICNDGFVITKGGKKVIIDALYQRNIRLCRSDLPELMENNLPPFDNVDLVLVTHNHPDHFNAQIVGKFLLNNPKAVLVAEKAAADMLLNNTTTYGAVHDRIHSIELASGQSTKLSFEGIELGIFSAPGDVPNLAFLIQVGGKKLFHSGDLDFSPGTKAILNSYEFPVMNIDVAFVPYFLMIDPEYREEMSKIIGAEKYILMHYAEESNPEYILNTLRILAANDIVFEKSLQTWTMAE